MGAKFHTTLKSGILPVEETPCGIPPPPAGHGVGKRWRARLAPSPLARQMAPRRQNGPRPVTAQADARCFDIFNKFDMGGITCPYHCGTLNPKGSLSAKISEGP